MVDIGHFEKIATQKACGAISYEPIVGSPSNLLQLFLGRIQ